MDLGIGSGFIAWTRDLEVEHELVAMTPTSEVSQKGNYADGRGESFSSGLSEMNDGLKNTVGSDVNRGLSDACPPPVSGKGEGKDGFRLDLLISWFVLDFCLR